MISMFVRGLIMRAVGNFASEQGLNGKDANSVDFSDVDRASLFLYDKFEIALNNCSLKYKLANSLGLMPDDKFNSFITHRNEVYENKQMVVSFIKKCCTLVADKQTHVHN